MLHFCFNADAKSNNLPRAATVLFFCLHFLYQSSFCNLCWKIVATFILDDLVVKKCKRMSGKVLKNLFLARNGAFNLTTRRVSTFKGGFGANRTSLTKWYWLLSGTGVAIGYFAFKSLKNSTQIYALQQRKVINSRDSSDDSNQIFHNSRMSLLKRRLNWLPARSDSLNLHLWSLMAKSIVRKYASLRTFNQNKFSR